MLVYVSMAALVVLENAANNPMELTDGIGAILSILMQYKRRPIYRICTLSRQQLMGNVSRALVNARGAGIYLNRTARRAIHVSIEVFTIVAISQ